MKILFTPSDNDATSGAFLCMTGFIKSARKQFHIDPLVILPNSGDGAKLLEEAGIPYILIRSYAWTINIDRKDFLSVKVKWRIKRILNWVAIRKIRKLIRQWNPDIVYNNTTWGYVGALSGFNEKKPVIWHFREIMELQQNMTVLCGWVKTRKYFRQADQVIAVSHYVLNYYKNMVSPSKSNVIYEGVNKNDSFCPNHLIFQNQSANIIMVGGFLKDKGQDCLIDAIDYVKKNTDFDIKVNFIGNDNTEYGKYCRKKCRDLNLDNIISFLGRRNDVSKFLSKSDIAIIASGNEAFGRTTVEALLSGCLVIAANAGATPELIQDNISGLLFKREKKNGLGQRIIFAIENAERMQHIAKVGQDFAVQNYTADINAFNIYSKCLKRYES